MPEATISAHHDVAAAPTIDHDNIPNEAAPGISYYTPKQDPVAGSAADPQSDGSHPPKLFQPLKIRGLTLQNRIMVRYLPLTRNVISLTTLSSPPCANTPLKMGTTPPGTSRTWAALSNAVLASPWSKPQP